MIAGRLTYAGVFMVTFPTLMFEILLTRIFSVTMWHHFAFVAVSIAMFGTTVGALIVYLFPKHFAWERTKYYLALYSFLFSVSVILSFVTHLHIPFSSDGSIRGLLSMIATYAVISIPFMFSGICVCLALTRFPQQVSRLYAADLAGAAMGCVLLIYILEVTDAPTAMVVVSSLATIGTAFFAAEAGIPKLKRAALATTLLLAYFAAAHTVLVHKQFPLLRLLWVKGGLEGRPLYEKWNSFSRIKVYGDPTTPSQPAGWGLSDAYPSDRKVKQLNMEIDAGASTVLTAFEGDLNSLEHLKYDVTNLAHYIRSDAKVLVIGAGGGRDILAALVFGQKSVLAIELNEDIIGAVNHRFGDFTGHLDRNPKVAFVNDEARSYIARLEDRFDIIQASFVDTWAATAAGAFALTENSLYTVEAWKLFLNRLSVEGILTFSHWYFPERPGEMYRLTSLAVASLLQLGVENPQTHIVIARHTLKGGIEGQPGGVGTILVSRRPFSDRELDTLGEATSKMQFDIVLSPRRSLAPDLAKIASGKDLDQFMESLPINIAPPTDDSPFFFHTLRLRDLVSREPWAGGIERLSRDGVLVVVGLFIFLVLLTSLCIIVPLILTIGKASLKRTGPLTVFFASIGLGFMLVEISQMQRLTIFLGHPTYGLSVVLFSLLLSSGLGSFLTRDIKDSSFIRAATFCLAGLLCVLIIFGVLTPYATRTFEGSITLLRVLLAGVILFPIGLFMGMAFPLGMRVATVQMPQLTPWLWGINGATSVCASVLAVLIALSSTITRSFWTGFACYLVAFIAFFWASRRNSF